MFKPETVGVLLQTMSNKYTLQVINLLCNPETSGGLKIDEIHSALPDIPKSTLYRLVGILTMRGLAENKDRVYYATDMAFHLAGLLEELEHFSRLHKIGMIRKRLNGVLGDKEIEVLEKALEAEKTGEARDIVFSEALEGISILSKQILESKYEVDLIISVSSGGAHVGGLLSRAMNIPLAQVTRSQPAAEPEEPHKSVVLVDNFPKVDGKNILLVDDICKAGVTLELVKSRCTGAAEVRTAALLLVLHPGEEEGALKPRLNYWVFTTDSVSVKMPWDRVLRKN